MEPISNYLNDEDYLFNMLGVSSFDQDNNSSVDTSSTSSPETIFSSSPQSPPSTSSPYSPPSSDISSSFFTDFLVENSPYTSQPIFTSQPSQTTPYYATNNAPVTLPLPPVSNRTVISVPNNNAPTSNVFDFDFSSFQADTTHYDPSFLNEIQKQYNPMSQSVLVQMQPNQSVQYQTQTQIQPQHQFQMQAQDVTLPSSSISSPSNSNVTTPVDNRKRQRDDSSSSSEEENEARINSVRPIANLTTPFVPLTREQLLKLNSKEIEQYVANLKATRTLSATEERELKKQRRLIKNREYASQSRERKKNYHEGLERKLEDQTKEFTAVKIENQSLRAENEMLKRQLAGITATIKASSSLSSLFTVGRPSTGSMFSGPKTAASACLLAVLCVFTFTTLMSSNSPLPTPIVNNSVSFFDSWFTSPISQSQQSQTVEDNPYAPKPLMLRKLLCEEGDPLSDCESFIESENQGEVLLEEGTDANSKNETLSCVSIEDIFPPNNNEVLLDTSSIKQSADIEQTINKKIEL
eukprot:TRINITY_DN2682_c0_g2_i1.p1 TRINITY_DN2682_c0_g2~~TRINITY_DN2682_c0_g2_i1.p1  ORF type:complete len:523 (-),score=131.14 TRINITY_DN2682_c0_g2_i1:63-1631(-)